jgi:hypothetical protein
MNPQATPTPQYNPNEVVTITNKKTGDVKRVSRAELPSYGLPSTYQSPVDTYAKSVMSGAQDVSGVPAQYKTGVTTVLNNNNYTGAKPTPSADELKKKSAHNELLQNAQNVLNVLNEGKGGKLQGQAYKDALDFASSKYAASSGFGEGGKSLTGPELTVLGGAIPVIKQSGQNIIDKITGNMPPQRGHVVDDPATLERKMLIAVAELQGKKVDPSVLNNVQSKPSGVGGLLQNAGGDVKGMLNGLLNIPALAVKAVQHPDKIPGGAVQVGKGVLNEYNQLAGKPLEGGDIVSRIGQHAYDHPVDTVADILPLLKAAQLAKGAKVAQVATDANAVAKTGEAAGPLQKAVQQVGTNIRSNVRSIDVGPNLYGPQREARINQTLNNLGIKGSPADQYAQLQPKMSQLSDQIESHLTSNPQNASLGEITKDFKANLQDQLRTKNLQAPAAEKEISGYLSDLHGAKLSDNISTYDLFKLKKQINQDYQGVAKKLNSGSPLNDREKVISAARQTLDDVIATKHPEVKQATLMQSDLYDATESLHKARNKKVGVRVFGNFVPVPGSHQLQAGKDAMGRALQRVR